MSAQLAFAPALDASPQSEPAIRLQVCAKRALVIDDNPDVTDMLAIVLHRAGYEVSAVHSASSALVSALTKHFDVIISDIGMPGMDGYELARALRELPEYRTTPMIAVTGFAMYDDRDRALQAGFNAHLSKPIDPLALTQALSGVGH